jgi:hypothetical protein
MADPSSACPNCGAIRFEGAQFCVECGTPLTAPPVPAAPRAATQIRGARPAKPTQRERAMTKIGAAVPAARVSAATVSAPSAAAAPEPKRPPPRSMSEALASVTEEQPATALRTHPEPSGTNASANAKPTAPITDMLEDIDGSFEAILSATPSVRGSEGPGELGAQATGGRPEDLAEVRALFKQIAADYVRPVRDLMIEIKLGEPPKEWVHVCRPAVSSLKSSAAQMGLDELVAPLDTFLRALDYVENNEGALIGQSGRIALTEAYVPLVELMPEAFALKEERNRREPIIVQSLLRQVPDVRKVALDRIYAAGLTTLEMLFAARPSDLADATGLERTICERIVERFQRYRREVAHATPDAERTREHVELRGLAQQLAQHNAAYDQGSAWRGQPVDKRRVRKERADTVLQINVLLARLGNVELVNELERLPFGKKVERIERYLAEAARGAAQA